MPVPSLGGKPMEHFAKVGFHSRLRKKTLLSIVAITEAAIPAPLYFNVECETTQQAALHKATFFSHAQEHSKTTTLKFGGGGAEQLCEKSETLRATFFLHNPDLVNVIFGVTILWGC